MPPEFAEGGEVSPEAAAAAQAAIGATAGDQVAPPASAPSAPETVESVASEGQEPAGAPPETAEGAPGASPEQSAAGDAQAPVEEAVVVDGPGYLGHAPGDPGFETPNGTPAPPNGSPVGRMEAEKVGYLGVRSGEAPRRGL